MNDGTFDWKSLSAKDFERICRDLFARELGTAVEAFATGADGGVDLRAEHGRTIIQCKRYTGSLSALLRSLKAEAQKPGVRRAKHYMLAVTLPLTPQAKTKIRAVLPALRHEEDIRGADDLEGMLAQHRELRALYPALWLGDADYLRCLIREAVGLSNDRRSKLEMEEIAEAMRSFVPPPQTEDAMRKLRESRALIITGKPGIGKTSLARHLIWQLCMGEGYELVYIDRDINDGLERFEEGKKQIFLYDDFLGSTLLREGMEAHKGRNVTAFIHKLRRHDDKLLILTSREYIFRQAGQLDEDFRPERAAFSRYLLTLRPYEVEFKKSLLTRLAQKHSIDPRRMLRLLNRHPYSRSVTRGDKVLYHPNFNPRLLDTALQRLHKLPTRSPLGILLLRALDHPFHLYETAFLRDLSEQQRAVLLVLGSLPDYPSPERFRQALKAFAPAQQEPEEAALRVLIGDFLTTHLLRDGRMMPDFVNPGVRDFIHEYYRRYPETAERLIDSAQLPEQLMELVQVFSRLTPARHHLKRRIAQQTFRYLERCKAEDSIRQAELYLLFLITFFCNHLWHERKGHFLTEIIAARLRHAEEDHTKLQPLIYSFVIDRIPKRDAKLIDWEKLFIPILNTGLNTARLMMALPTVLSHLTTEALSSPALRAAGQAWGKRYADQAQDFCPAELREEERQLRLYDPRDVQRNGILHFDRLCRYVGELLAAHRHAKRSGQFPDFPPLPDLS